MMPIACGWACRGGVLVGVRVLPVMPVACGRAGVCVKKQAHNVDLRGHAPPPWGASKKLREALSMAPNVVVTSKSAIFTWRRSERFLVFWAEEGGKDGGEWRG